MIKKNIRIDRKSMELISLFNNISGAIIKDCLVFKNQEYGLTKGGQLDYSEMTRIGHIMFNSIFIVMNRSLNGMEAKRIFNSLNLQESYNSGMGMNQKKGLLDTFKFWKP